MSLFANAQIAFSLGDEEGLDEAIASVGCGLGWVVSQATVTLLFIWSGVESVAGSSPAKGDEMGMGVHGWSGMVDEEGVIVRDVYGYDRDDMIV